MNKLIKLIALILLGFIAWMGLCYIGASFYELTINPEKWNGKTRAIFLALSVPYCILAPLIGQTLNKTIK